MIPPVPRPVRILQVGGGVFLRGFLDWMVDVAVERGAFDGAVAIALSTDPAFAERLRARDMRFAVRLRGLRNGVAVDERREVRAVTDAFGFAADWPRALRHAASPDLRAIVSNTTERGLADHPEPRPAPDTVPASFPARLAMLLHARWRALGDAPDSALLVLPCELLPDNGPLLRRLVRAHAERWALEPGFLRWLDRRIRFLSTLVDRIVPGAPPADDPDPDPLAVVAEPFHLWVIEGGDADRGMLPLHAAGLDVLWTADLSPWREAKLRVLNGGHLAIVPAGLLSGLLTVGEAMHDPPLGGFLQALLEHDILPFLPLPAEEARRYAAAVLERFRNPFIRHELAAIMAGALDKWRIRLLPSLKDGAARDGTAPPRLGFTLAALLRCCRAAPDADGTWRGRGGGTSFPLRDDPHRLARIAAAWDAHEADLPLLAARLLSDAVLWQEDLSGIPGLVPVVAAQLARIEFGGIAAALSALA